MEKRIKMHTALMYINGFIATFCFWGTLFACACFHYSNWKHSHIIIAIVYNIIIAIYASIMTCRYERSVGKLKAKFKH